MKKILIIILLLISTNVFSAEDHVSNFTIQKFESAKKNGETIGKKTGKIKTTGGQRAGNWWSPALQQHHSGTGGKDTQNINVVGTNIDFRLFFLWFSSICVFSVVFCWF